MYNVGQTLASNPVGTVLGSNTTMNDMSSEDFYQLLITQLSQQDPFEPVQNQDIINQVNTIRSMESDQTMVESLASMATTNDSLNQTLQSMMLQNDMITGSGLLGCEVEALAYTQVPGEEEGVTELSSVIGIVTGVKLVDGEVNLDLDLGDGESVTVSISDVGYVGLPGESKTDAETDTDA